MALTAGNWKVGDWSTGGYNGNKKEPHTGAVKDYKIVSDYFIYTLKLVYV